jgi:hypothetical protein
MSNIHCLRAGKPRPHLSKIRIIENNRLHFANISFIMSLLKGIFPARLICFGGIGAKYD